MAFDTDVLTIVLIAFFVLLGAATLLAITAMAWLLAARRTASAEPGDVGGLPTREVRVGPAGVPQTG